MNRIHNVVHLRWMLFWGGVTLLRSLTLFQSDKLNDTYQAFEQPIHLESDLARFLCAPVKLDIHSSEHWLKITIL